MLFSKKCPVALDNRKKACYILIGSYEQMLI